jgi:hypothetical protein
MVNYGILSAALVFPALDNLEVRVNVELRCGNGEIDLPGTSDELMIVKIETVKAVSELMHFELSKELAMADRSVAKTARSVLKGAHPVAVHHDQLTLDLFDEAIESDCIEVSSYFGVSQQ